MGEEKKSFIVEVEKAREAKDDRPSMGPVYRSCFSNDSSPPSIEGLDSCWDVFRSLISYHLIIYIFIDHISHC
jgi:long-chain acyl-CoA synthetase